MLIKVLTNPSGDYVKTLKQRRLICLGFLAVGLVGFACYFLLVPGSSLSDYAQGFYLGAATGIVAGALVLLVRTQYLLTHPAAQKKAKIKETDEREVQIVSKAAVFAGLFTFFCAAAALFVLLPFSKAAYSALLAVMATYTLAFAAANLWLSQKL